jgi:hypothetical protein
MFGELAEQLTVDLGARLVHIDEHRNLVRCDGEGRDADADE